MAALQMPKHPSHLTQPCPLPPSCHAGLLHFLLTGRNVLQILYTGHLDALLQGHFLQKPFTVRSSVHLHAAVQPATQLLNAKAEPSWLNLPKPPCKRGVQFSGCTAKSARCMVKSEQPG